MINVEKDIVPELLELINNEFDEKVLNSEKIKKAIETLNLKQATYLNANEFAIELGEILSSVLNTHITVETLPNGRMYFNIADRVLNDTLKKNYDLITGYVIDVQNQINESAGIKIKGQTPKINQHRIDGMVERLSEEKFEEIKWIINEPIKNFSQSIVDDVVRANVSFQAKAGLKPKIKRIVVAGCCDWCKEIEGIYDYKDAPYNIYQRHRYCRCTVEYDPGDGMKQNVHTKKWVDPEREAKIEARKMIGVSEG